MVANVLQKKMFVGSLARLVDRLHARPPQPAHARLRTGLRTGVAAQLGSSLVVADRAVRGPHCHAVIPLRGCAPHESDVKSNRCGKAEIL